MSGVDTRRINYLLQIHTSDEIATELGIDVRDVNDIATGSVILGPDLRAEIRAFYSRTAYQQARQAGMSTSIARSIRNQSPERFMDSLNVWTNRVLEFTEGAVGEAIARLDIQGEDVTQSVIDQLYAEKYTSILDGLRNSKADLETIMDERY